MTSELEDGGILRVDLPDVGALAIYRVGEQYFATDDRCTHAAESLSDGGYLEDFTINCSWHAGAFDIRTGEATALPCIEALKTYPVIVADGAVYVQV